MTTIKNEAVTFDVDGTLADVRPHQHLLDPTVNRFKDWDGFYAAGYDAAPIVKTVEAAKEAYAAGKTVIILTARSENRRVLTLFWLVKNGVPFDRLVMRPAGDTRRDFVYKREALNELAEEFEVIEGWEDNPGVIEMMEAWGLNVEVVPTWDHTRAKRVDHWHKVTPAHLHGGQNAPINGQDAAANGEAA